MKKIKNMRELELMQKNLEYQQLLSEKKLLGTTAHIVEDFTDSLKDLAFEFGSSLIMKLFFSSDKHKSDESDEE